MAVPIFPIAWTAAEVALPAAGGLFTAWVAYRNAFTDEQRAEAIRAGKAALAPLADLQTYKNVVNHAWEKSTLAYRFLEGTSQVQSTLISTLGRNLLQSVSGDSPTVDQEFWNTIRKSYPGGGGNQGKDPNNSGDSNFAIASALVAATAAIRFAPNLADAWHRVLRVPHFEGLPRKDPGHHQPQPQHDQRKLEVGRISESKPSWCHDVGVKDCRPNGASNVLSVGGRGRKSVAVAITPDSDSARSPLPIIGIRERSSERNAPLTQPKITVPPSGYSLSSDGNNTPQNSPDNPINEIERRKRAAQNIIKLLRERDVRTPSGNTIHSFSTLADYLGINQSTFSNILTGKLVLTSIDNVRERLRLHLSDEQIRSIDFESFLTLPVELVRLETPRRMVLDQISDFISRSAHHENGLTRPVTLRALEGVFKLPRGALSSYVSGRDHFSLDFLSNVQWNLRTAFPEIPESLVQALEVFVRPTHVSTRRPSPEISQEVSRACELRQQVINRLHALLQAENPAAQVGSMPQLISRTFFSGREELVSALTRGVEHLSIDSIWQVQRQILRRFGPDVAHTFELHCFLNPHSEERSRLAVERTRALHILAERILPETSLTPFQPMRKYIAEILGLSEQSLSKIVLGERDLQESQVVAIVKTFRYSIANIESLLRPFTHFFRFLTPDQSASPEANAERIMNSDIPATDGAPVNKLILPVPSMLRNEKTFRSSVNKFFIAFEGKSFLDPLTFEETSPSQIVTALLARPNDFLHQLFRNLWTHGEEAAANAAWLISTGLDQLEQMNKTPMPGIRQRLLTHFLRGIAHGVTGQQPSEQSSPATLLVSLSSQAGRVVEEIFHALPSIPPDARIAISEGLLKSAPGVLSRCFDVLLAEFPEVRLQLVTRLFESDRQLGFDALLLLRTVPGSSPSKVDALQRIVKAISGATPNSTFPGLLHQLLEVTDEDQVDVLHEFSPTADEIYPAFLYLSRTRQYEAANLFESLEYSNSERLRLFRRLSFEAPDVARALRATYQQYFPAQSRSPHARHREENIGIMNYVIDGLTQEEIEKFLP